MQPLWHLQHSSVKQGANLWLEKSEIKDNDQDTVAGTASADLMFQVKTILLITMTVIKAKLLKLLLHPSFNHLFGLVKVIYVKRKYIRKHVEWKKTLLNIIPRQIISNNNWYQSQFSSFLYECTNRAQFHDKSYAKRVYFSVSLRGGGSIPLTLIYDPDFPEKPITHTEKVTRLIVTTNKGVQTLKSRVPSMEPRSSEHINNGKSGEDERGGRALAKRSK